MYRYIRLVVNTQSYWRYKSIPKPSIPTLNSNDVTVIVPTIENATEELRAPLLSILACDPAELILVTTIDKYIALQKFTSSLKDPRITVYYTRIANKRIQLREAIPRVNTQITILVDDDVTWPTTILPWVLAALERPHIGSVGVCQRVRRITTGPLITRCWNWLGADYIERRNFEIAATHRIDGGTSCMSGRTNAIRTEILKDPLFLDGFCKERWGRFHLNADDDNFITRWLVNHDWKTWIQFEPECEIETTLENNTSFLWQCLRWARSNWRSNWTTLFTDRKVWITQRWTVYALYLATFTSLGMITDPFFFYAYSRASANWNPSSRSTGWIVVSVWYLCTKIVKRIGLYRKKPSDIFFLPVSILFGFVHGIIKIRALLTWNVTAWGNRPDGDVNDNERMTPQILPSEVMTNPAAKAQGLIRYNDDSPILPGKACKSQNDGIYEKYQYSKITVEEVD